MPGKTICTLPVYEQDGKQALGAVRLDQPYGKIVGGGTNQSPLEIQLAKPFSESHKMLDALRFVDKYAAMQAHKGRPLPSQLTKAVAEAVAAAEGR